MPWQDPKERFAALRAWLDLVIRDPELGMADLENQFRISGDLFDEGNLDGGQYHLIYQLHQSLRASPRPADVRDQARLFRDSLISWPWQ